MESRPPDGLGAKGNRPDSSWGRNVGGETCLSIPSSLPQLPHPHATVAASPESPRCLQPSLARRCTRSCPSAPRSSVRFYPPPRPVFKASRKPRCLTSWPPRPRSHLVGVGHPPTGFPITACTCILATTTTTSATGRLCSHPWASGCLSSQVPVSSRGMKPKVLTPSLKKPLPSLHLHAPLPYLQV